MVRYSGREGVGGGRRAEHETCPTGTQMTATEDRKRMRQAWREPGRHGAFIRNRFSEAWDPRHTVSLLHSSGTCSHLSESSLWGRKGAWLNSRVTDRRVGWAMDRALRTVEGGEGPRTHPEKWAGRETPKRVAQGWEEVPGGGNDGS